MKASDLFVKALENEGVEYIFGVPGEENLDFLESLRTSKIRFIVTRHEQAAGFMAATIGRLTGRAGVALSTLGPGATNLLTAVAYANLGGMPAVFITGQKPVRTNKQGHFQIVNTTEVLRPVTKFTAQIASGALIPARVREAFRMASEERPGAVHLELPEDVAREDAESGLFESGFPRRPVAEEKAVARAVNLIETAKSPLLLVGAGANRKLVSKILAEFIAKTGIPFFNTQMGKGVVDERNPLFLGTATLSEGGLLHCAVGRSDLIINVGHDVVEKPPFIMEHGKQRVIHINFSPAHIDNIYFPQAEVIGDVANALWQIKEHITVRRDWDFDYFHKVKAFLEKEISQNETSDSFPVLPQRIISDLRKVLPLDGIVALDNGMYKLWFARNFKAFLPNTLLLDNALATMGAGLPAAIAAKLVNSSRKVVAVCGDGGFMMNSQELETAKRLGLDLVIIILNDGSYGMIKWKQEDMNLPAFAMDYGNPDFVKYAESYGVKGYRVGIASDFFKILGQALDSPGVHVIDLPVDYSQNKDVFSKEKICP